jgi:hypothetical protein
MYEYVQILPIYSKQITLRPCNKMLQPAGLSFEGAQMQ